MARPKKVIDAKQVQDLASVGCKTTEIARLLGTTDELLNRRFMEELTKGRESLKMSLRRWQLESAKKGNVAMLIWLGKQYLEQTEKIISDVSITDKKNIVYKTEWGSANEAIEDDSATDDKP